MYLRYDSFDLNIMYFIIIVDLQNYVSRAYYFHEQHVENFSLMAIGPIRHKNRTNKLYFIYQTKFK